MLKDSYHETFSESNTIFALDIGTRTVIGIVCRVEDNKIRIIAQEIVEHDSRAMVDGQINDIPKVAAAVIRVKESLEEQVGFVLTRVAVVAAGRSLVTRCCFVEKEIDENLEIDDELVNTLELDGLRLAYEDLEKETRDGSVQQFYCVGYSVVAYYLDKWLTPNLVGHRGKIIGAEVLATFLPHTVVNSLYSVLKRANLESISLTLEPIAAIDVAIPDNFRLLNLALVDIGAGTSDIAITRKGSVVAYGMVPVAGDELTEALVERCLVDFAWAEKIKRSIASNQLITYQNVLGLEDVINSEEAIAVITPGLEKLSDEIASTIQTLNGGQSPSAVFCVGGGAQTPGLPEKLANKLGLPVERVAIRGRQAIVNLLVDQPAINGPEGVTVVGIASVAIKKFGHDFITISVNGREFKLFNSEELDVANAIALVGYNSRQLIGRNGRNLEFKLNGCREIVFGEIMKPAEIFVNDQPASLQTPIYNGDKITVISAEDGQDAEATVKDFLHNHPGISVVYQDQVRTLEPCCFLNGVPASYNDQISSGDQLDICCISKIEDFFREEGLNLKYYNVLVNNIPVNKDYILRDGDRVELVLKNSDFISHHDSVLSENRLKEVSTGIKIMVNDEEIFLEGNREHIFVEVFNHIDFDLNRPQGMINLQLNGRAAGFTDVLRDGDRITISWGKKE